MTEEPPFDLEAYIQNIYDRYTEWKDRDLNVYIAGKRCKNCSMWMHSSECPREEPGTGKRSGYSVGPHSESLPCKSFTPNLDFNIACEVQLMKKLES